MDLLYGLAGQLSWWCYVVILLLLTHLTIMSVTLYLHRCKTHGTVEFHAGIEHIFRFWLWLTTGMKTHEWVAVHRKHHDKCETEEDPHSPKWYKIWDLFVHGIGIYRNALRQEDVYSYVQGQFSKGLPTDWLERNIYSKYPWLGLTLLGVLQVIILGLPGLIIFGFQAYWIPGLAMGVINGFGHYWGYRNFATPDESRNIFPWGILIGGEELHNNHHAYQTSPRFTSKWWEIDIGWFYIRLFEFLGLAKVDHNKVARIPISDPDKEPLGRDEWLELFRQHPYYIGTKFEEAVRQTDNSEVLELIDGFRQWYKAPNEVAPFDLEQWVGRTMYYGYPELQQFSSWFRGLHYAQEYK